MRSSSPSSSAPSPRSVPPIPLLLLRPRTPLPWVNHLILPFCLIYLLGVVFGERQEVTEESSIGVDFQSFGRGVLVGLIVDVHVIRIFVFPQPRRGGMLEAFQLPPKPIQSCQNVSFVLPLLLPVFIPPSPCREQTAFGVFCELFFQI